MTQERTYAQRMMEPLDRGEQIETTVRFILDSDDYYIALGHLPNRLSAAAQNAVRTNLTNGYHLFVLRSALTELWTLGQINLADEPYRDM